MDMTGLKRPKSAAAQKRRHPSDMSPPAQKRERGRTRNACERCKQKKTKCEDVVNKICRQCRISGDICAYVQKPHEEKRQYRKGYVEMVEESNIFLTAGLLALYKKFRDQEVFSNLEERCPNAAPTAQEILSAIGVTITGKPHEGTREEIAGHLERDHKPMLARDGEWDRIPGSSRHASSNSDEDADERSEHACHDADDGQFDDRIMFDDDTDSKANLHVPRDLPTNLLADHVSAMHQRPLNRVSSTGSIFSSENGVETVPPLMLSSMQTGGEPMVASNSHPASLASRCASRTPPNPSTPLEMEAPGMDMFGDYMVQHQLSAFQVPAAYPQQLLPSAYSNMYVTGLQHPQPGPQLAAHADALPMQRTGSDPMHLMQQQPTYHLAMRPDVDKSPTMPSMGYMDAYYGRMQSAEDSMSMFHANTQWLPNPTAL